MTQEQLIDDTGVSETPSWPTLRHAIAAIKDAEAALEGVIETCRADTGIHAKIKARSPGLESNGSTHSTKTISPAPRL